MKISVESQLKKHRTFAHALENNSLNIEIWSERTYLVSDPEIHESFPLKKLNFGKQQTLLRASKTLRFGDTPAVADIGLVG